MSRPNPHILTLNSGSSSLKAAIYAIGAGEEKQLFAAKLERIGQEKGQVTFSPTEAKSVTRPEHLPDHAAAIGRLLDFLTEQRFEEGLAAIGHRVVMGGPRHTAPQPVDAALREELNQLCGVDPVHMPTALATIAAAEKFRPKLPQVACFDTAFHRNMPKVAQTVALPRALTEELQIVRYGFHGLSYEYIVSELRRVAPERLSGRVVIAHLGNGASMTALRDGKSLETTMGFTPLGGLVMGSRTGDLDPGVISYLLTQKNYSGPDLNRLLYQESGLLGLSGLSSDLQDLERAAESTESARAAVELFVYQARKQLGALVAVLDGLDSLIFTGGIGEHSKSVRRAIGEGFSHLGLRLDRAKNESSADVISDDASAVEVRVIKTNEELMIARHTAQLLSQT